MKVIRINVENQSLAVEPLKEDWKYFGNRGLIAKILTDEVDPTCDPLGPENKFIFATGLLAGTPVPTSDRLSVGCKSPLTFGIKEANSGGNFAGYMSNVGIRSIIIEGLPRGDDWKVIHIDADGEVKLLPADEYMGLGNYDFVHKVQEKYGEKTSVASIGIAGERLHTASTIQVTDNATGHPGRAAARGGVGAVLGTKKIKGVIIEKANKKVKPVLEDKARFNSGKKALIDIIKSHPYTGAGLAMLGTPAFVDSTSEAGILPVKNFNGERLSTEKLAGVETRSFISKIEGNQGKVGVACQAGCTVRCSNIYADKDGKTVTTGLEYETIAMFGPNCDIYDMDFLAECDRFCDDMGLDTIEIGVAIGIAMDTGKIPWGSIDAVRMIFDEIKKGTEFGRLISNGAQAVGDKLNSKRIPTVRNQAMAAYDPRGSQGMGITFSTSTQGADHTTINTLGIDGFDHQATKGIAQIIKKNRNAITVGDNLMCMFAMIAVADDKGGYAALGETLSGLYGKEFTEDDVEKLGIDTLLMENEFNKEAGFKTEDNKLADFFYEEIASSTGEKYNVSHEEVMESI